MAAIVFAMLPEEGHLLTSFKLARELISHGHEVCYIASERQNEYIHAQGFKSYCLTGMPLTSVREKGVNKVNELIYGHRNEIVACLKDLRPELLIVDAFTPMMALIAYRVDVPMIFMNTSLDTDMTRMVLEDLAESFGQSKTVVETILKIPEMVTCPREYDFQHTIQDNRTRFYIEASIDLDRKEPAFRWEKIEQNKPLIYCALGSQSHHYVESKKVFQAIIDALALKQEYQMILSVGMRYDIDEFYSVPPNVLIVNWSPQLEILKRASIMITHGGIGTVKECIFLGVPMIVFPMMRNQPMTGARVVYHGLGVRGDINSISAESVLSLIEKIEKEPAIKARVEKMGRKFQEIEKSQKGLIIIQKFLNALFATRSRLMSESSF